MSKTEDEYKRLRNRIVSRRNRLKRLREREKIEADALREDRQQFREKEKNLDEEKRIEALESTEKFPKYFNIWFNVEECKKMAKIRRVLFQTEGKLISASALIRAVFRDYSAHDLDGIRAQLTRITQEKAKKLEKAREKRSAKLIVRKKREKPSELEKLAQLQANFAQRTS